MDKPYIELRDRYGNPIYLGNIGDFLIPAFPAIPDFRQHKEDILNMELNPCDVIITGFPKTDYFLWGNMKERVYYNNPQTIEALKTKTRQEIRRISLEMYGNVITNFNVLDKKVKLVYLERNPKDTWVSMYNQAASHKGTHEYNGTWNHFFELMVAFGFWYGDWFDFVLGWEKVMATQTEVPIITMTFEELKKDPVGQIERLDQFLGFNRGRELCKEIADACSFSKLKQVKDKVMPLLIKNNFFKETAVGFYRKGDVGDWKNWFTVAQNEQFDALYAKRMKGSKLKYIYEL